MAAGSKKNPEPSSSSSSGDLGGKTVQELLDMDKDAVSELVSDHFHQLYSLQNHLDVDDDDDDHWAEHNEQEDRSQLQERLAFYRIIGYQVVCVSNYPLLLIIIICRYDEPNPVYVFFVRCIFSSLC